MLSLTICISRSAGDYVIRFSRSDTHFVLVAVPRNRWQNGDQSREGQKNVHILEWRHAHAKTDCKCFRDVTVKQAPPLVPRSEKFLEFQSRNFEVTIQIFKLRRFTLLHDEKWSEENWPGKFIFAHDVTRYIKPIKKCCSKRGIKIFITNIARKNCLH